jgi:hypothetical protein
MNWRTSLSKGDQQLLFKCAAPWQIGPEDIGSLCGLVIDLAAKLDVVQEQAEAVEKTVAAKLQEEKMRPPGLPHFLSVEERWPGRAPYASDDESVL